MINFFRKIRYNLMEQNKTGKYLKYAIGEIVLVMIGILLALQVNNWNQNRINDNIEKTYYQRFLDDVYLDEEILIQQIELTKNRLFSANTLLSYLQQENVNMKQIANAIRNSVSRSDYKIEPTKIAYEDVKASGNLNLIRDLELKYKLDKYYSNLEGMMNNININASRLALRMLNKEDLIGTGFANMTISQNGIDSNIVNLKAIEDNIILTQENRIKLMNDAMLYSGLTSRNLQHFKLLLEEINKMKQAFKFKVN